MKDAWPLKINQNLLGLFLSLGALGFAEFYHLNYLLGLSLILSVLFSISNIYTLVSYTRDYHQKSTKESGVNGSNHSVEKDILKKKWNKKSLWACFALVGAYGIPWAITALSSFITEKMDRISFFRWHEAGRVEPFPIDLSYSSIDYVFILAALIGMGLLCVAFYFSWEAIQRTRSGAERGWSFSVLMLALSVFSLLFFALIFIMWFLDGA